MHLKKNKKKETFTICNRQRLKASFLMIVFFFSFDNQLLAFFNRNGDTWLWMRQQANSTNKSLFILCKSDMIWVRAWIVFKKYFALSLFIFHFTQEFQLKNNKFSCKTETIYKWKRKITVCCSLLKRKLQHSYNVTYMSIYMVEKLIVGHHQPWPRLRQTSHSCVCVSICVSISIRSIVLFTSSFSLYLFSCPFYFFYSISSMCRFNFLLIFPPLPA